MIHPDLLAAVGEDHDLPQDPRVSVHQLKVRILHVAALDDPPDRVLVGRAIVHEAPVDGHQPRCAVQDVVVHPDPAHGVYPLSVQVGVEYGVGVGDAPVNPVLVKVHQYVSDVVLVARLRVRELDYLASVQVGPEYASERILVRHVDKVQVATVRVQSQTRYIPPLDQGEGHVPGGIVDVYHSHELVEVEVHVTGGPVVGRLQDQDVGEGPAQGRELLLVPQHGSLAVVYPGLVQLGHGVVAPGHVVDSVLHGVVVQGRNSVLWVVPEGRLRLAVVLHGPVPAASGTAYSHRIAHGEDVDVGFVVNRVGV